MALDVLSGVLDTGMFDLEVKLVFFVGNLIVSAGNVIASLVFTKHLFHFFFLGTHHE